MIFITGSHSFCRPKLPTPSPWIPVFTTHLSFDFVPDPLLLKFTPMWMGCDSSFEASEPPARKHQQGLGCTTHLLQREAGMTNGGAHLLLVTWGKKSNLVVFTTHWKYTPWFNHCVLISWKKKKLKSKWSYINAMLVITKMTLNQIKKKRKSKIKCL